MLDFAVNTQIFKDVLSLHVPFSQADLPNQAVIQAPLH